MSLMVSPSLQTCQPWSRCLLFRLLVSEVKHVLYRRRWRWLFCDFHVAKCIPTTASASQQLAGAPGLSFVEGDTERFDPSLSRVENTQLRLSN